MAQNTIQLLKHNSTIKPKPKTCKVCKDKFNPYRSMQKTCSIKCAIEFQRIEREKQESKEWKERKAKLKVKLETYSQRVQKTRKVFQKWIRERDKHLPCISCGSLTDKVDAGHYLKAEIYSGLIFNEDNCWSQCKQCNGYRGGAQAEYRIGLVKRIGEERVKHLEEISDQNREYSYSREELKELREKYKL